MRKKENSKRTFSLTVTLSLSVCDVDQQDYLGIFHRWIVFSEKGTFQTAAAGWDRLK